jgi:hypothetical protein
MAREPRLEMLPDKDMKLTGEHFRKVVRRIESIVPLAGEGIKVEPKEGGYEITNDSPAPFGECGFLSQGYGALFQSIALNVCSNGTPDIIYVLQSKRGASGGEDFLCEI